MILVLLLLAASAYGETDPARLNRGAALAREHKWAEAEATLKGVEPPNAPGERIAFHRLRAAVASGLGHHREAAEEMRSALRWSPANKDLLLATAVAERAAGEIDAAIQHFRAVPETPAVLTMLAEIYELRGDHLQAVKAYQRAAELAPNEEQYRLNLALEFMRHDTFDAAIRTLEPMRSPRSRVLLALAQFAVEKNQEAAKALLDASDLEPGWSAPVEILGELQMQQMSAPDAAAVDRVCAWADRIQQGHAEALCGGLVLRLAREENDRANAGDIVDRLRTAANKAPEDATAECELARAYDWLERWTEARAPAEACSRLSPEQPEAQARLARVYQRLGLTELARTAFEKQKEASAKQAKAEDERRATVQRFILGSTKQN